MGAVACPPTCPALAQAESWLPCRPALLERPNWELQRLMLETGRLDLTGVGECMFPAVQPGDRIVPQPLPVEAFQVGQVAVLRRGEKLVAHRVIDTGADAQGAYIITQGDNNGAPDAPSYAGDVAGVVRAVFRGGRRLADDELRPGVPRPTDWLRAPRRALYKTSVAGLRFAQRLPGYHAVMGRLLRRPVAAMKLEMHLPLNLGALSALVRRVDAEALAAFRLQERDDAWLLRACQGEKVHARLHLLRARPGLSDGSAGCRLPGWWLTGLDLSLRWARCGLEERLLRAAAGVLRRSGVEALWVRETPELAPFWRRWPALETAADIPARRVAVADVERV